MVTAIARSFRLLNQRCRCFLFCVYDWPHSSRLRGMRRMIWWHSCVRIWNVWHIRQESGYNPSHLSHRPVTYPLDRCRRVFLSCGICSHDRLWLLWRSVVLSGSGCSPLRLFRRICHHQSQRCFITKSVAPDGDLWVSTTWSVSYQPNRCKVVKAMTLDDRGSMMACWVKAIRASLYNQMMIWPESTIKPNKWRRHILKFVLIWTALFFPLLENTILLFKAGTRPQIILLTAQFCLH